MVKRKEGEFEIMQNDDLVTSVARALDLLDSFSSSRQEYSVAELAELHSLPKSTVVRLLGTLKAKNFIEQDEVSRKYRLGFKLYFLGQVYGLGMNLRNKALPLMRTLNEATGETVNLNVLHYGRRVCVEMLESSHEIRSFVKIGERLSPCFGAAGRTLLAYEDRESRKSIMEQDGLDAGQIEELEGILAGIREKGSYVSVGNRIAGLAAISSPLFGLNGSVIGCLSLSGPADRITVHVDGYIEKLIEASTIISRQMGHSK